jgi:hypothetical protein
MKSRALVHRRFEEYVRAAGRQAPARSRGEEAAGIDIAGNRATTAEIDTPALQGPNTGGQRTVSRAGGLAAAGLR